MTNSDQDSTTNIGRSGGADLNAQGDININGDVVGRDKIVITGEQQYDVRGLANPYLGLQSFTYADHAKFAGREKLVTETVVRLTAPDGPLALLFVTGASGSGKSSFVQAGVLPALKEHYGKQNLEWAVFRPSCDPLAALTDAVWRQLGLPQFDASTDFGDFLQAHTPAQQVNVIVIDQFEELFTQSNAQPRDALFDLLKHLPPFRVTRTHIIATVRADYLPELFALRELYDIAKRGIDLRAMSVDELREAVRQPLRATYPDKDKHFQSELVDRLAKDAAEDAAYLPLLQVTLEEIWRKGALTVGSYTNLAEAIKQRADKVLEYQDYDAAQPNQPRLREEQAAILNLGLDLVDVSLDDEARRDVRRRRTKDELISGAPERARLIDALTQARLLSVGTENGEPTRVEVDLIHETLLSNWDRLRQAIAERRNELRQRVRFEQQLKEWIGQNRSDDYLLSGVHLAEARELERRDDVALHSADAKDFVRCSVDREEARHQKELNDARRRVAVFSVVAIVALVAASIAFFFGDQSSRHAESAQRNAATAQAANTLARANASTAQAVSTLAVSEANIRATAENDARRQSEIAFARLLAVESQIDYKRGGKGPLISTLLAVESMQRLPSIEAEQSLRQRLSILPRPIASMTHEDFVRTVAFSPDGKRVASGSNDKTVRVWEAATGKEIVRMTHRRRVNVLAFSLNGKWIISGSADKSARVWDATTGREIAQMTHEGAVYTVEFSPDGKWVVSGSADGTARVWETATGKEVARMPHDGEVDAVAFSPDGKWVVSGSADGTARVWEAATGREVARMVHDGLVRAVAFSPNGKWVMSGGADPTVRVWEADTGREIIRTTHDNVVYAIAVSPNGKWVVSGSYDNTARVWDVATGIEVARTTHEGYVQAVAFSPDGKWVVSGGVDGSARVWEAATGHEVVRMAHDGLIRAVAFSPDSRSVVSGSDDKSVRVWEVKSGQEVAHMLHENLVYEAAFSPDGKWVVSGGKDGTARVWEAITGKEIARITHNDSVVNEVAFSPDGKWVVSGSKDGEVRVWEATTGRDIAHILHDGLTYIGGIVHSVAFSPDGKWVVSGKFDGTARVLEAATAKELARMTHDGEVTAVAFSPDGKWVVSGSYDKTIRVWETATGKEIARMKHDGEVYIVAFSPDGKWVVSGANDKTARVWEAATDREAARMVHEGDVFTVAFSPDSKWVVSGSSGSDGSVIVWEAETGREIAHMKHDAFVRSVAFSPDGKWIVSGSEDKTVRVWEAATGREVARMAHDDLVRSVAFSPDGKWVVSASNDKSVRVWLWRSEDILVEACARLPRNLTHLEWEQFVSKEIPYHVTCSNLPAPNN